MLRNQHRLNYTNQKRMCNVNKLHLAYTTTQRGSPISPLGQKYFEFSNLIKIKQLVYASVLWMEFLTTITHIRKAIQTHIPNDEILLALPH